MKTHIAEEEVALIALPETTPGISTEGVEVMASLKVAVTTTLSYNDNSLSASLSVSVTLGGVVSTVKIILSIPE